MLSAVLAEGLRHEGMLRMREGVQLICSEASLSHVWWVSFCRMPFTTRADKHCQQCICLCLQPCPHTEAEYGLQDSL